jgi:hypothetical protein
VAANLSPEYKNAQERYRKTREPHERLECLREMLRTIPKHKGTEHLQADLKTALKELTEELTETRKGAARGGPALSVRPEGAAQVALVGPPNSGKSSLHARLTGSHAVIAPYPCSTHHPLPGMLPVEDIHVQLVDLPPVSVEFFEAWLPGALQTADGALLVVDLGDPACIDDVAAARERLAAKRIHLVASVPAPGRGDDGADDVADPLRRDLPTLLVANKSDLLARPETELGTFVQLAALPFTAFSVSAESGSGLGALGPALIELLGIVRVYSKVPGHAPDLGRPFTVRRGDNVRDVATQVHRGLAGQLKFARVWGPSAGFDGQQVSAEHTVRDGDVIELHT